MSLERKPQILVVDDDAVYRELLEMALEGRGYEILLAQDGSAACAILEREDPDLILLDMLMPRLDGIRFLEWLRQEARRDIPVLVNTCLDQREATVNALVAGATEVVVKPVSLPLLFQKLDDMLSSIARARESSRGAGRPLEEWTHG
ncbi:MAG: response regulator [Planctomycetes bacterium]|nr:response regulator [Planctomycetota bacterium]